MLIRYKRNLEKIAMGLLSFMQDEKKDIKKLQETIQEYETNSDWQLFLWKQEDDVLGLIGLRTDDGANAFIQHLSVDPSHRNSGVGQKMIKELHRMYGEKYNIQAVDEIENFYYKSKEKMQQDNEQ